MSHYTLRFRQKVSSHLAKNNLNISAFEKKIGVTPSIIGKILASENRVPSVETLIKVADYLECSLDDLIDRSPSMSDNIADNTDLVNLNLFRQVCYYILYYIESQQINSMTSLQMYNIIDQIYQNALRNQNLDFIDKTYADWYLKHNLSL